MAQAVVGTHQPVLLDSAAVLPALPALNGTR